MNFADRLITGVRGVGHPLCLGLDPHRALIPEIFGTAGTSDGRGMDVNAVRRFLRAVLELAAGRLAIVKPQSAFYEVLGPAGSALLAEIVEYSRQLGFLVLLDAKRGDIGSTASAYAEAYLSPSSLIPVDAMTVNPYLGLDTLKPFSDCCREFGRGIFTLVKTSNPGSGDFQDRDVDGAPLYERVAAALKTMEVELMGETGWSSSGVVVGATYPGEAERVREVLPHSLFLVPGYGSQGASARDAVTSFVPGPSGLEGGIVSSSRGLLFPPAASQASSAAEWENAFRSGLDAAIAEIRAAVETRV